MLVNVKVSPDEMERVSTPSFSDPNLDRLLFFPTRTLVSASINT
jgi:hypothetical protein